MPRAIPSYHVDERAYETAAVPFPGSLQGRYLVFPLFLDYIEAQTWTEERVIWKPSNHINVTVVKVAERWADAIGFKVFRQWLDIEGSCGTERYDATLIVTVHLEKSRLVQLLWNPATHVDWYLEPMNAGCRAVRHHIFSQRALCIVSKELLGGGHVEIRLVCSFIPDSHGFWIYNLT